MKKYVKPIMGSEEFVANEYVGACWYMDCGCRGDQELILIKGSSIADGIYEQYKDSLTVAGYNEADKSYIITGNLYGKDGEGCIDAHPGLETESVGGVNCNKYSGFWYWACTWLTGIFGTGSTEQGVSHHHVSITLKGNSDGPNAS